MMLLLAIDLGGTKTRIGCYEPGGDGNPLVQGVYQNRNFVSIEEVITRFLEDYSVEAGYCCLAAAGVVEEGYAELTNLDWIVRQDSLRNTFGFNEVFLVNDLTALSKSVVSLQSEDLVTIKAGNAVSNETIGVIAPGTGLGQGYLVPSGSGFIVKGSEGGHSGFTPSNPLELDILSWLVENGADLSAEQVCAGPGIGRLYRYFEARGRETAAVWIRSRVETADDITPIVVEGATADEPCPLCRGVVETYLAILGRECANLALKLYARGGVYIGGGVLLHLHGKISMAPFVSSFTHTSKVQELLDEIPIFLIKKQDALLLGAYECAMELLAGEILEKQ